MKKKYYLVYVLALIMLFAVAWGPGARTQKAKAFMSSFNPQTEWKMYVDEMYGFSIVYPQDWIVEQAWETGQSVITVLHGPNVQAFVIIENRPGQANLGEWLSLRDRDLVGEIVSEQTLSLNQAASLRREFTGWNQRSLSVYIPTSNKFYEFNAGPITEETRPILEKMVDSLAVFDTPTIVPTRIPATRESGSKATDPGAITAPTLQFPFPCNDQWQITCGYFGIDPYCQHPNNQYNWYGLDWVRSAGGTDGQPVVAAHGGQIHNGWDSTGGGNITKVAEDGNFNHYITFYAHLKSFSQPEGAWVNAGNEIARADCTGSACNGTHLHFAYWYNNQSVIPEPMSGHTGFRSGQQFSYTCPDTIPPATSASLSGTSGESGWYRSNVQVTLTASDNSGGSGLKLIQYKIDSGTWQNYSASFAVTSNGNHTVYYKSQDNAGNWESEKQTNFGIDTTPPTGALTINSGASIAYATLVYLSLAPVDNLSGISQIRLRDSGGSWGTWQSSTSSLLWQLPATTGQSYTVEVQFKDRAGNESVTYSDAIALDIYPARPSSTSHRLAKSTLGMSGANGQSQNYRLQGTAGQPSMIGQLSSTNYKLSSGYWAMQQKHTIYLPLILRNQ